MTGPAFPVNSVVDQEQFLTVLSREEALSRFDAALFPRVLTTEIRSLSDALGYALAEDVIAPIDVPPACAVPGPLLGSLSSPDTPPNRAWIALGRSRRLTYCDAKNLDSDTVGRIVKIPANVRFCCVSATSVEKEGDRPILHRISC